MRRRRRRCLLVPALEAEAVVHCALASGADEIVVDLDSVPRPRMTDWLRLNVIEAIGNQHQATAAIQINRPGTRWFDEDIVQIVMAVDAGVDCLVVPGVSCAEHVCAADELLEEIEAEFPVAQPIALEARIDDEQAVAELAQIVGGSRRLEAVVVDLVDPVLQSKAVAIVRGAGLTAVAGPAARNATGVDGAWRRLAG